GLEDRTTPAFLGSQIPPSSLSGFVYCDLNRNGIRDAGDTPLAGVPITLLRGSRVVATTFTGRDGSYQFSRLPGGTYTIVGGPIPPDPTMVFVGAYDTVGSIRGESPSKWGRAVQPNTLHTIRLDSARTGTDYNFAVLCTSAPTGAPGIAILK